MVIAEAKNSHGALSGSWYSIFVQRLFGKLPNRSEHTPKPLAPKEGGDLGQR
jgi:hypothetical protein